MSETSSPDLTTSMHDGETTANPPTMDAPVASAESHGAPVPLPSPLPPAGIATASLAGIPDAHAALATMRAGLAPEADGAARAAAMDLWSRLEVMLSSGAASNPHAAGGPPELPAGAVPATQPASSVSPLPNALAGSPVADMVRVLRQVPPEHLLDLVVARLRAALPAGAAVVAPRGIQFQLVPLPAGPTTAGTR